jgi:predicted membrane channel-forming protein YqfA (hemolysin III family)
MLIFPAISRFIGILTFIGMGLSIIAFFDCIMRKNSDFKTQFLPDGKYEKVVWLILILISARLFAIGSIAYYLMIVRKTS